MQQAKNNNLWASKFGFLMAAAGASVGLGNLQRFPQMVSGEGGASFVLVYLCCVFVIGLPLLCLELTLGRAAGTHPANFASALLKDLKKSRSWDLVGLLAVATAFSIFCYYSVNVAWTLAFALFFSTGNSPEFGQIAASMSTMLPYFLAIHGMTFLIVRRGLKQGVEFFSKILMPILLCLVVFLSLWVIRLDGWAAGMAFYLAPDWSLVTSKTWLMALSQAFFSLCIGEAVMLSFGSHTPKTDNLFKSALMIAGFDTFVALCSGCILFPALFSSSTVDPALSSHAGFVFEVMPAVFDTIDFGYVIGALFFLILAFAGLTTCIALCEMPVEYLSKSYQMSRNKACMLVSTVGVCLGLPALYSHGANPFLSDLTIPGVPAVGVHGLMDFIWGGLVMVLVGLLLTLFVGWVWGHKPAAAEFYQGQTGSRFWSQVWGGYIKYIAPVLISLVLLSFLT